MSQKSQDTVDTVLQNVPSSRRDMLKRLLAGTGAMALLVPMSSVLLSAQGAQNGPDADAPGQGQGKGRGKGKGKGKGRRGRGKGRGKGKGSSTPPTT